MERVVGINYRVALLNLNIRGLSVSIIQIYAATETAWEEEINTFNGAPDQANKNYIIMGDFNAKIGQPRKDEHLVMKANGYGERNRRGQKLIDLALELKLAILNTFFHKNPNRRWTWRSPNGEYKNEIYYVLSDQPNISQNTEVLNLNCPSAHRAVGATTAVTRQKKKRTACKSNPHSSPKTEQEIMS
nr:craniofacial development protein 2-like [Danaus plexippus plexippus]